jgi:hypothetical protein
MKQHEPWEFQAYEKAKAFDALYTPQMRSWSPFFRSRALLRRYVYHWNAARSKDKS